jgi:hypothetical protein
MSFKDSELDVDDYFRLEDIPTPSRPNEPRLKSQRPTLEEVEAYQAALTEYKSAQRQAEVEAKAYQEIKRSRAEEFRAYFFEKTGVEPDRPKADRFLSLCRQYAEIDRASHIVDVGTDWGDLLQ